MKFSCFILLALVSTRWVHTYTVPNKIADIPEGRIVGGHTAKPHSHPYMVSLQLRFLWIRAHMCGGSLLNERWILTAAHCVTGSFLIRWLNIDAVAGAHDVDYFGPDAQVSRIIERVPHPEYGGGIGPFDVAVLKTESNIIFTKQIQPINLPTNVEMTDPDLMLPGWGTLRTTVFIPDLPSKLQELKVTYVPFEKCNEQIENLLENGEENPLDKEANICTGPLGGGKAACNGDSGGPLVLRVAKPLEEHNTDQNALEDDELNNEINDDSDTAIDKSILNNKEVKQARIDYIPIVVGIVSWGISPCGEKGAPTVYTNVSRYMDFIDKHIYT